MLPAGPRTNKQAGTTVTIRSETLQQRDYGFLTRMYLPVEQC